MDINKLFQSTLHLFRKHEAQQSENNKSNNSNTRCYWWLKGAGSKTFKIILISVAALIVLLSVLAAGMFIGFKKADHSYRWGENYYQNFGGPGRGLPRDFVGKDFMGGHGVDGQIIKIDGSTLIIEGRDNIEKIVLIKEDTLIRRLRETIKLSDLKVDEQIVVIGQPNDVGQVEAKLIRVLPASPELQRGEPSPPLNVSPAATSSSINQ